jgi:hypothetical protein
VGTAMMGKGGFASPLTAFCVNSNLMHWQISGMCEFAAGGELHMYNAKFVECVVVVVVVVVYSLRALQVLKWVHLAKPTHIFRKRARCTSNSC